jgi:hypothetical protein
MPYRLSLLTPWPHLYFCVNSARLSARRATRFAWFVPMYIGLPPALLM